MGSSLAGDPDRGYGKTQPGGWGYSILAYLEQSEIRNLGAGVADTSKGKAMLKAASTAIPTFICPTRREVRLYPFAGGPEFSSLNLPECSWETCNVGKSDYIANSGNIIAAEGHNAVGNRRTSVLDIKSVSELPWNGITYQLSELRIAKIQDGTAKTLLVGEKYLDATHYTDGRAPPDRYTVLGGLCSCPF